MAASTATAAPEGSVEALPQAGEASVSDAAVAALALAPSVAVPTDVEWEADELSADSTPAPVIQPTVSRTNTNRTSPAASGGGSAAEASAPVSAPAANGSVVGIAMQYIGTPYVAGGATPAGFDCSGFTQYVFAQVGISLPRSSAAQRNAGTVVPASQAQPGDLVWWPGHVGIYLGNGQHVAARNPGTPLTAGPLYRSNPTYIRVG